MKVASVSMRDGRVFVQSVHETIGGVEVDQDDVVTLEVDDVTGIGAAVLSALEAFRTGVPTPESVNVDSSSAIAVAAGVRSWREFARGAKYVSVTSEGGRITLTPYRNDNPRRGFIPIKGRDHVVAENASAQNLGDVVIAALADAE